MSKITEYFKGFFNSITSFMAVNFIPRYTAAERLNNIILHNQTKGNGSLRHERKKGPARSKGQNFQELHENAAGSKIARECKVSFATIRGAHRIKPNIV